MVDARLFRWAYASLWVIRIWCALCGTGYIHPDEYMQNGEVTAGNVLGLHALTTWEWSPDLPVRSILPIFATTGLPLLALKLLFGLERLQPSFIFSIQRLAFLCLSGVLDYSAWSLVSSPASRRLSLLLLASSYVTCTFQVRPFSNSVESILLSLCLVLLQQTVDETVRLRNADMKNMDDSTVLPTYTLRRNLHLLAVLAVIGVFTRPTFIVFTLPIAYQVLQLSYRVAGSAVWAISLLLPPFYTAVLTATLFIAADSYYFRGDSSRIVITPYNFVKYNLSTENLAEHGLHPNWLHVGVNLPMLLGPLFIRLAWSGVRACLRLSEHHRKARFETNILRQTLIQIIVLSLSVLSAQPHQEPRFLTPLILPIVVLATIVESSSPGKLFLVTWTIFNVALTLVFGFLHQGGVVPSLFVLHSALKNDTVGSSANIVYWKTYMPPRHLLGVFQRDTLSAKISLQDLAGAPRNDVIAALSAPSFDATYLVIPLPMYLAFPQDFSSCLVLKKFIFPHLDLDHLPESFRVGGLDGLRLAIYAVGRQCIVRLMAQQRL